MPSQPLNHHNLTDTRAAGILLHLSSLPSRWGIGDLGPEAEKFLDFLKESGQRYWQFLPLSPTLPIYGHSPYMSNSAFAGNPLLISPNYLLEEGWIEPEDLAEGPEFYQYLVLFQEVENFKESLFEKAFTNFKKSKLQAQAFTKFCEDSIWLKDYALFVALGGKFAELAWHDWPAEIARRNPLALENAEKELADKVLYHKFIQYIFAQQWLHFKKKAHERQIRLIGDMPIYVALNSADVWAHQECFQLNPETLKPEYVAGVPPDYFSPTGQAWGNPLYRWQADTDPDAELNQCVTNWWQRRLQRLAELVDVVRIDHFRAFEAYWQIPAGAKTAETGEWIKGPGETFFTHMADATRDLTIIAEDLGTITPPVEKLRDHLGFAGMKVLQFAFDGTPDNPYLPWNFTSPNCVVYTGTHDNNTTLGWYFDEQVDSKCKERARRATNSDGSAIHLDFIKLAYASIAALAITPLQDALGFGSDCRMNWPGSNQRNWAWRCAPHFITKEISEMLYREAVFFNRVPTLLL